MKKKVVFCTPSLTGPTKPYIEALEASLPLIEAAGYEHEYTQLIGNPYISATRAMFTRAALDAKADIIIYLDYDVSWAPSDLLALIEAEGDVVAGTYRLKQDEEQYMSTVFSDAFGRPVVRPSDGAIKANLVPAGFLKITKEGINQFMYHYPELCYGPQYNASVDLFNHGAVLGDRIWWGEDYCFSWRWNAKCGDIWLLPDLNITHSSRIEKDGVVTYKHFPGNFHNFLRRQPGGDLSSDPQPLPGHGLRAAA